MAKALEFIVVVQLYGSGFSSVHGGGAGSGSSSSRRHRRVAVDQP